MEDSLYDIEAMRRFAGGGIEAIPDESRILNFSHFLASHRLTEKLFEVRGGIVVRFFLCFLEKPAAAARLGEETEEEGE